MPDWSLIAKYLAGETSPNENRVIEDWLKENESNRLALGRLRKVMRPSQKIPDFNDTLESDWTRIEKKRSAKTNSRIFPLVFKIAASILIILSLSIALWKTVPDSSTPLTKIEAIDSVKHIVLKDGSSVWLNRGSSLTVFSEFGDTEREIALEGEGYFEVAKDERKPFIINCGQLKTTVVGTAFNIHHVKNADTRITVTEGKVSVKRGSQLLSYLLPGESLSYNDGEKQYITEQNSDANFLSWKTGVIRFESADLKYVCEFLSDHYGITIQPEERIKNYKITVVFDNLSVEQAIQIISTTLGIKSSRTENTVILSQ